MLYKKLLRVLLLLTALVGAVITAAPSQRVFAGSNGQQIYFSCPDTAYGTPAMDTVVVNGYNQNGHSSRWQSSVVYHNRSSGNTFAVTTGAWWVGTARIYWRSPRTGAWDSMTVSVPRQQNGDYSYFQCPRHIW